MSNTHGAGPLNWAWNLRNQFIVLTNNIFEGCWYAVSVLYSVFEGIFLPDMAANPIHVVVVNVTVALLMLLTKAACVPPHPLRAELGEVRKTCKLGAGTEGGTAQHTGCAAVRTPEATVRVCQRRTALPPDHHPGDCSLP